ncbi:MAG: pyrimidine 5'-nucleotidase [Chloroflexi bacterium]|nr:pyrimidine 5'-nucleotidase [Chloroflexota bacterium]
MTYTTLLIDLDETVYAPTCGVWEVIEKRMEQYMHERLGIDVVKVPAIRRELFLQYGTTLRGLQATYAVNEREFLEYVHDLPLDRLLKPDPVLREALHRLPQRKLIFTNADRWHARRVMRRIGIEECFEGIIDILDLSPYCKPMPEAFVTGLRLSGETDPGKCVFVDDSPKNLNVARELGFFTVQVGRPKPDLRDQLVSAHVHIDQLSDLPRVLNGDQ